MIEMRQVSVHYPDAEQATLSSVDLQVSPGELVLVCGPTGCGKSTLLNCLNGSLVHESSVTIEGDILLDGTNLQDIALADTCRLAGSVFQNPETQICSATPETEVAFGLENLGVDRDEMQRRITEVLALTGLSRCAHQATDTLSGGQQQRLALACALALKPKILLLDEPLSQLDSGGAREVLGVLDQLRREHGLAIVLVEHRLDEAMSLADRVVMLVDGQVKLDLSRDDVLADLTPLRKVGLNLPMLADLFERIGRPERPLSASAAPRIVVKPRPVAPPEETSQVMCCLDGLSFGYGTGPTILNGIDLTFWRGERVALMGRNGTGKSTLLHLLAGTFLPATGSLAWEAGAPECGLMVQNPDLMLFSETVRDEVAFAPLQAGKASAEIARISEHALAGLGIADLAEEAPFSLSRGQRLRTAVASIVTQQPRVLLLDEPTSGQDRLHVDALMSELIGAYDLVVFCTHDVGVAARHATRLIVLDGGGIAADGPTRQVLYDDLAGSGLVQLNALQAYAARLGVQALDVDELAGWCL